MSVEQASPAGAATLLALDDRFPEFRRNRLSKRAESPTARWHDDAMPGPVRAAVTEALSTCLHSEHPAWFRHVKEEPVRRLQCRLTGESLAFDPEGRLTGETCAGVSPPYRSALDALFSQVQEDGAVFCLEEGGERLCGYVISSPSGWAPEEKRGLGFLDVHGPVPGFAASLKGGTEKLLRLLTERGPFVRFGWGLAPDDLLDRHSHPIASQTGWPGRLPAPGEGSPFVVRVERQVLWPLPEVRAFLFLIRLYFTPAAEIAANPEERSLLATALRGLSPDVADYKGIARIRPELLGWLDAER